MACTCALLMGREASLHAHMLSVDTMICPSASDKGQQGTSAVQQGISTNTCLMLEEAQSWDGLPSCIFAWATGA